MNWYASLPALKLRLGIDASELSKDALCADVLEGVSRTIERHCKRWFYPLVQTYYYTPATPGGVTPAYASELLVDDLLAVTSLQTDQDGDLVYETLWTPGTDFTLGPYNAAGGSIPEPYWSVHVLPYGHYRFPVWPRSTQIIGTWGYYDVRQTAAATLGAAISSLTATTITLSASPDVQVGQTLFIDTEQLFVSALNGASATVVRGVNGTTAATHVNGAALQVATYPLVTNACLFQAELDFVGAEGAAQARGGGPFAQGIQGGGLHPFAQRMLASFGRDSVG